MLLLLLINYSIYPATYTVSITPLSSFVTTVDAPKIIPSSTIFQIQNDVFNFAIDPLTPIGTLLSFDT